MLPEIEKILQLQGVDADIAKLEAECGQRKQRVELLGRDTAKRAAMLKQLEAAFCELPPRRHALELELKTREDKLARARKQAELVRTPKELEAANHQIEMASAEISRFEEQTLELMEQEENLAAELSRKKAAAEKQAEAANEEVARLTELQDEAKALLRGLREDRVSLANRLDEDLRASYEWLLGKFGASVAVRVNGQACGGCDAILIPSLVLDAKLATKLTQCNHCLRYLVADEASR
jgi:hypothetical protein